MEIKRTIEQLIETEYNLLGLKLRAKKSPILGKLSTFILDAYVKLDLTPRHGG